MSINTTKSSLTMMVLGIIFFFTAIIYCAHRIIYGK